MHFNFNDKYLPSISFSESGIKFFEKGLNTIFQLNRKIELI